MKGNRGSAPAGRQRAIRMITSSAGPGLLLLMAISVISVPTPAPAEEEGWLTNYDQVEQVTRQAVDELLESYVAPSGDQQVQIGFAALHEASWLVEQLLTEKLSRQGVAVAVAPDSMAVPDLEIKVIELGLSYTGTSRRNLLGSKQVERLTVALLSAAGRDVATGSPGWTNTADVRVLDEVPAKQLPILEGQAYPFTAPTVPPSSSGKVIEPIIVSAIVVSLVFLFVSNSN